MPDMFPEPLDYPPPFSDSVLATVSLPCDPRKDWVGTQCHSCHMLVSKCVEQYELIVRQAMRAYRVSPTPTTHDSMSRAIHTWHVLLCTAQVRGLIPR